MPAPALLSEPAIVRATGIGECLRFETRPGMSQTFNAQRSTSNVQFSNLLCGEPRWNVKAKRAKRNGICSLTGPSRTVRHGTVQELKGSNRLISREGPKIELKSKTLL